MERHLIPLKTDNHEFAVKSYATAREANTIQQSYLVGTKIEVIGEQPKISEFNPGVQFEVQQEMIRQMVVSMDGSAENILERCLDLPSDEFDSMIAQLDDLIAKKKK
ncbi:MAG: hypothetical protein ABJP87_04380 [Bauldia litoralis]|uniref:hypothetical protein n=1 Tax=Bauldia litoralis TaxID=665467 RepID=UPI00329738D4